MKHEWQQAIGGKLMTAGRLFPGLLGLLLLSLFVSPSAAQDDPAPAADPAAPSVDATGPQEMIERGRAAFVANDFATAEEAAKLTLEDVKQIIEAEVPGAFTKKAKAPTKKAAGRRAKRGRGRVDIV